MDPAVALTTSTLPCGHLGGSGPRAQGREALGACLLQDVGPDGRRQPPGALGQLRGGGGAGWLSFPSLNTI